MIQNFNLEGREKHLIDTLLENMIRQDTVVQKVVSGEKFIGVMAGDRLGLSSLLGARPAAGEKNLAQEMTGKTVRQAAEMIRRASPYSISLGLAALNAGNTPDPARIKKSGAPVEELIVSLGHDKITGLVGEFPFVPSVKNRVKAFHLFELKPGADAVPRDQWEDVLGRLDVFVITATTILNRSMAWFLSRVKQAKVIILGPTTPCSAALFDWGADYLCGSVVTDIEKVADGVRSGLPFKQVKRNGGIVFTQWEKTDFPHAC